MTPECCVNSDLRRRIAEERADTLLRVLNSVRKARTPEQAKRLVDEGMGADAVLMRADRQLEWEADAAKRKAAGSET